MVQVEKLFFANIKTRQKLQQETKLDNYFSMT